MHALEFWHLRKLNQCLTSGIIIQNTTANLCWCVKSKNSSCRERTCFSTEPTTGMHRRPTKKQFGKIYHAAVSQGKATQERVPNFLGWCEIIMMMCISAASCWTFGEKNAMRRVIWPKRAERAQFMYFLWITGVASPSEREPYGVYSRQNGTWNRLIALASLATLAHSNIESDLR